MTILHGIIMVCSLNLVCTLLSAISSRPKIEIERTGTYRFLALAACAWNGALIWWVWNHPTLWLPA